MEMLVGVTYSRCFRLQWKGLLLLVAALINCQATTDVQTSRPPSDTTSHQQHSEHTDDGWSPWSQWSSCSRSCDGGASVQSRRCRTDVGCPGNSLRYKLCNLQPCPAGAADFRSVQCSEYDSIPYKGRLQTWVPALDYSGSNANYLGSRENSDPGRRPRSLEDDHDPGWSQEMDDIWADPCALVCKALDDPMQETVVLSPSVHDGTRCSPGKFDMCINGRCERVGCDFKLGSELEVDSCGVCGGNGSTCEVPPTTSTTVSSTKLSYRWEMRPTGPCSTTCGGGYQMVTGVCVSSAGRKVLDQYCDIVTKPIPNIETCAVTRCPTRWQAGEWGACSEHCGSGYQLREVYCLEPGTDDTRVPDHYCAAYTRPDHKRSCNTQDCPRWYEGIWSKCSVTCGSGIQTRSVQCRDSNSRSSELCPGALKPSATRSCRTGISCPLPPEDLLLLAADHRVDGFFGDKDWWSGPDSEESKYEDEEDKDTDAASAGGLLPVPQALTHDQPVPTEPTFIVGEWEACSVTCDTGIAKRSVACKIFLEFSRTVAPLPDDECAGVPPARTRDCTMPPCPQSLIRPLTPRPASHLSKSGDSLGRYNNMLGTSRSYGSFTTYRKKVSKSPHEQHGGGARGRYAQHQTLHSGESRGNNYHLFSSSSIVDDPADEKDEFDSYELTFGEENSPFDVGNAYSISAPGLPSPRKPPFYWRTAGFGPCSATCLGGVQESLVECVRRVDDAVVAPNMCALKHRPDVITQTCNDVPCPPRWRVGQYSNCTKLCGGGTKSRKVECIHEMTRGNTNTMVVPTHLCSQPQPPHQDGCNVVPCDAEWTTQPWSKCSVPCGGGMKTRSLRCRQVMSNGHVMDQPPSSCPRRRPNTKRRCNKRKCPFIEGPDGNSVVEENDFISSRKPIIRAQANQNYLQKKYMKKVKLKVGGEATVFRGVLVKVKCPVRHFDRSRITWYKDGRRLGVNPQADGNIHVTRKGAIKINRIHYTDGGVYVCKAENSEGNLTIHVKPLPSSFSTPDDRRETISTPTPNHVSLSEIHSNHIFDSFDIPHRSINEVDHGLDYNPPASINEGSQSIWRKKQLSSSWETSSHLNRNNVKSRQQLPAVGQRRSRRPTYTTTPPATLHLNVQSTQSAAQPNLGEGPYKASSKNMHTMEETSEEQESNSFLGNLKHLTNTVKEKFRSYLKEGDTNSGTIIGTVNGSSPVIPFTENKGTSSAPHSTGNSGDRTSTSTREYVYGTVTHSHHHVTPVTARKGISLLAGKISQSRSGNPKDNIGEIKKHDNGHIYGTPTNWSDWSAGKDLFDERTVEEKPLNHVYGTITNTSSTEHKIVQPFGFDLPPGLVSEEDPVPSKSNDNDLFYDEDRANDLLEDEINGYNDDEDSLENKKADFEPLDPQSKMSNIFTEPHKSNKLHQTFESDDNVLNSYSKSPEPLHQSQSSLEANIKDFHSNQHRSEQTVVDNHEPKTPLSDLTDHDKDATSFDSFNIFDGEQFGDNKIQESLASSRGGRHAGDQQESSLLQSTENLFGTPEILGKGTRESLSFEWEITNWSECSQTCGYSGSPGGYQVRSTQCMVRVANVSKPADAQLCEDAGLKPPSTIQYCGLQECPQWNVGEWSSCKTSRCFTLHYAYQRRKVTCQTHSGSITSPGQCDQVTKPRHRRECYNADCVGVWHTGAWTECMAPCGGQGYRTRLLQCVWNGTRRAAGNACRGEQRPEVVRWCDALPCTLDDTSRL